MRIMLLAVVLSASSCGDDSDGIVDREPAGYDGWSLFSGADLDGVIISPTAACAAADGASMRVKVCTIAAGSAITALHLISEGRVTADLFRSDGLKIAEIDGESGALEHRVIALDPPSVSAGGCYTWSVAFSAGSCVVGLGLRTVVE